MAALCAACTGSSARPPRAEFIIATADSAYWVSAGRDGMHVRGVPLTLARYGGRFREIYVTDLDRSFDDAVFTGERLYVRDLVTNDSALVFDDSGVVHLADRYAREYPDARPLSRDEDPAGDPNVSATGEMEIIDVRGPFVLFEHRLTVEQPSGSQSDTVKTAVDLRNTPLGIAHTMAIDETRQTAFLDSARPPVLPFTWKRTGYELLARHDTTDGSVSFFIRDAERRLWPVARTGAQVRVYWLDAPPVDAATRHALAHAFNSAAEYDESVKYVRNVIPSHVPRQIPPLVLGQVPAVLTRSSSAARACTPTFFSHAIRPI